MHYAQLSNPVGATPFNSCSLREQTDSAHEQQIICPWHANAKRWTKAIQTASVHRRTLVTDRVIVDAAAIAPAPVIFICKARVGEQTDRMEQHR